LTGLVFSANKNKNCQLSYSRFQTSQTGGQWYSDTSPFSIPWLSTGLFQLRRLQEIVVPVPTGSLPAALKKLNKSISMALAFAKAEH
jgi:hypothetical protein